MPIFNQSYDITTAPGDATRNTITPTATGAVALNINPADASTLSLNILDSSTNPAMVVTGTGSVGIGTNIPGTNRLYTTWITGDTNTTAFFGAATNGNNQIAVNGSSGTAAGVYGFASSTGAGISGSSAGGISGYFISNYFGNSSPTLVTRLVASSTADTFQAQFSDGSVAVNVASTGNLGIGESTPSAYLHIKAGTASGSTSPIKLTAGTNLTVAEAGAVEFDGTRLYYTTSTPTRKTVATVKQTEIDFGSTPVADTSFTVSDSDINSSSKINAWVAYDAPTGKDLDEVEMDEIDLKCGQAGSGSFIIFARPREGYVSDKFKVNYIIG